VLADARAATAPPRPRRAPATETVWALVSPELHQLLTGIGGWSRRRYVAWLQASLEALLLEEA
jgi:hypothetical protein